MLFHRIDPRIRKMLLGEVFVLRYIRYSPVSVMWQAIVGVNTFGVKGSAEMPVGSLRFLGRAPRSARAQAGTKA